MLKGGSTPSGKKRGNVRRDCVLERRSRKESSLPGESYHNSEKVMW